MSSRRQRALIVGGGVAGTTCAVHLTSILPTIDITLIDPRPALKLCHSLTHLSHSSLDTTIQETEAQAWCAANNIKFQRALATSISSTVVTLDDGSELSFDTCCIASGARPFIPPALCKSPFAEYILTLRDTDSVSRLKTRLRTARRVIVIGAGGIGMEVVHEIEDCDVIWVVKSAHIGGQFFDEGIADFVQTCWEIKSSKSVPCKERTTCFVRSDNKMRTAKDIEYSRTVQASAAVGPNWLGRRESAMVFNSNGNFEQCRRSGRLHGRCSSSEAMRTINECELTQLKADTSGEYRMIAELSNGDAIGCDIIILGTGVVPNTQWTDGSGILRGPDGGLHVEPEDMHTIMKNVFAAGDCSHIAENRATDWIQLRTWGQAMAGGRAAAVGMAQCLDTPNVATGLEFEIFAHSTQFFGERVVLLGRWKAQGLSDGFKILEYANDYQFVRVTLHDNRIRGVVLIGDTDNAEVFENLIVSQMDVGWIGDGLVDPNMALENFFD